MMWKQLGRAFAIGTIAATMSTNIALADQHANQHKDKAGMPPMDANAQASMMAEMEKMGKPGPEHKMLEAQAGKWTTVTKSWMGGPEPAVSNGKAEYELILGGRFLMARFHDTMMGQPFEGFSITGYDRMAKSYNGYWIDTMSTGVYPMNGGTWDEATKSMTFNVEWPNPMGSGTMPYKMVTKFNGPDSMVFLMTMAHEGKDMPLTEVTYTRAK